MKKTRTSILIMTCIVTLILVSTIFIQLKTVEKSNQVDVESLRDEELKEQIAQYKTQYDSTMKQYNETKNKILEYETSAKTEVDSENLINKEYDSSIMQLGLTDVEGPGVIITLKDTNEANYTSEDIRNLVNELKFAGAEAISINGYRIINLSDIVTLNDSFIVMDGGSARITSPYEVKVIGDQDNIISTLNQKTSGYVVLMKSNLLDINVVKNNDVKINKYTKNIDTDQLKEVEGE